MILIQETGPFFQTRADLFNIHVHWQFGDVSAFFDDLF